MLNKLLLLVAAAIAAQTTEAVKLEVKDLSTVTEPIAESNCLGLAQANAE